MAQEAGGTELVMGGERLAVPDLGLLVAEMATVPEAAHEWLVELLKRNNGQDPTVPLAELFLHETDTQPLVIRYGFDASETKTVRDSIGGSGEYLSGQEVITISGPDGLVVFESRKPRVTPAPITYFSLIGKKPTLTVDTVTGKKLISPTTDSYERETYSDIDSSLALESIKHLQKIVKAQTKRPRNLVPTQPKLPELSTEGMTEESVNAYFRQLAMAEDGFLIAHGFMVEDKEGARRIADVFFTFPTDDPEKTVGTVNAYYEAAFQKYKGLITHIVFSATQAEELKKQLA